MKKMIGVEVIGMTACPCAMETVQDRRQGNLCARSMRWAEHLPQPAEHHHRS